MKKTFTKQFLLNTIYKVELGLVSTKITYLVVPVERTVVVYEPYKE